MKSFCSVFPNSFPLRTGPCLLRGLQEVQCEIQDFVVITLRLSMSHMMGSLGKMLVTMVVCLPVRLSLGDEKLLLEL